MGHPLLDLTNKTAVVIGGTSSLVGALVGAGLIVATRDWLAGPWPGHGPLLLGLLFIAAVYARLAGPTLRRLSVRLWTGRGEVP